ncbi:MAG TPA: hypothetical protein VMW25_02650 [Clostridia bacterium]|nr:hypothetical protein [Clostridia bacterium]
MNFEFIELEQIETLKTLEVLVSEVDVYVNQSKNYVRGYGIVSEWNEFLKETVKLSDFVPCGSDGLPLEEIKDLPKNIQIENLEQVEKYHKFHIYQKAKQAVIFEGWEVESHDKHDGWMTLKNGLHTLVFDLMPCNDVWICDLEVNTYSDLAKATINNPLKFRK